MKTAFCTVFFLCATAAFAQTAVVLSNNPQPMIMADHAQHATQHALATETSLLDTSVYSYAKGEVPLSDLGSIQYETPLGDVARAFRKEHAAMLMKPVKVLEKQN
ncbi:MAG: hypothetical protein WA252_16360 [Candidatus Sulfotelmatobacter sp.]|jgi:hypothetical protein